jgi:hypothetical protein
MNDFDNSFLAQEDHPSVHEDAIVFEIKDQPIGWRASGLALKRASDKGVEAGELLVGLQSLFGADINEEDLEGLDDDEIEQKIEDEMQMEGGMSDFMSVVADLVWIGTLHFEPKSRRESILGLLDADNIESMPVDRMLRKIFPAIESEVTGDEEKSGKGKAADSEN